MVYGFRNVIGATILGLATAGAASATTLSIDYLGGASGYRSLRILDAPVNPIGGGNLPDNVLAGAFELRDNAPGSAFGTFIAWCLDLSHWLATGGNAPYQTTTTPFSNSYGLTSPQITRLQTFFDANYADGLENNRDQSAGFQMGLWEVLYDDNFDLASGDFRGVPKPNTNNTNQTAYDLAQGYLMAADDYTGIMKWDLTFLESQSNSQNLVTVLMKPPSGPPPVPLPASALLLLTGMAGLGVAARRRKA